MGATSLRGRPAPLEEEPRFAWSGSTCAYLRLTPQPANALAGQVPTMPAAPALSARRALAAEGLRHRPGAPFTVREYAPVVPGCGDRSSDQRYKHAI